MSILNARSSKYQKRHLSGSRQYKLPHSVGSGSTATRERTSRDHISRNFGSSSERTEPRRPFHSESFPIRVSVSRHSNWFRWIPSGRNIEDAKSALNGYPTARLMETSKTTLSVPGMMGCQSRQPARLSDTVYSEAEANAGTVTRGDEDGDGDTRDHGKTDAYLRNFPQEQELKVCPSRHSTLWPARSYYCKPN